MEELNNSAMISEDLRNPKGGVVSLVGTPGGLGSEEVHEAQKGRDQLDQ